MPECARAQLARALPSSDKLINSRVESVGVAPFLAAVSVQKNRMKRLLRLSQGHFVSQKQSYNLSVQQN
jgi:hypothetical protein